MTDDMRRRRQISRLAFIARRGELGITQEEAARRGRVAVRTVQNFEAGRWPNPSTRARLEKAVEWPPGEIHRMSLPPQPYIDPQLLDRVSELSEEAREWLISWLLAAEERLSEERRQAAGG